MRNDIDSVGCDDELVFFDPGTVFDDSGLDRISVLPVSRLVAKQKSGHPSLALQSAQQVTRHTLWRDCSQRTINGAGEPVEHHFSRSA
ncbi:hypothetical protein A247_27725 [Pseudomonas syringae pv. actinidiae ICMP 19099]|nr:hypothetical protein A247_27725 [Pseudomonas syringae pv. actinidiae ICMP 19099]EPN29882.1 hypothetical protein A243_29164 [Pseudomonas syringae pv. actinidiae ICMP 18883]EPN47495.1 hypothetical protein A241_28131 [Pseudomonas syringae pv. actinidiae ICMP 19094]KTC44621.1 hypothetical protein AO250_24550 [Pseudomonas syringae pv. actinidiae ICMP 19497]NAT59530.1 hypothetical protein [Pseudomonas syringae pv. actinidifoliorum]